MSSKLTFENSVRLQNAQIGLDRGKLFGDCWGMTPSYGSEFFFSNLKIFLSDMGAQSGQAIWTAVYY